MANNIRKLLYAINSIFWKQFMIGLYILLSDQIGELFSRTPYTTKDGLFNDGGYFIPWDEYYHNPNQLTGYPDYKQPPVLPDTVEGTAYTIHPDTPDFREVEAPLVAVKDNFMEYNRYYRITPKVHIDRWHSKTRDYPKDGKVQCYCVTVYKRLTNLGMGAVVTTRHIMTTALSTDMIVKRYENRKTLLNILGGWYETNHPKKTNTTVYFTPVRIHYHPLWNPPEVTNRSFPLPCIFDIAIWAAEKTFWGGYFAAFFGYPIVVVCQRCTSTLSKGFQAPTLQESDITILIGSQMIMDIGRVPFPWFKYMVRTKWGKINPCPKSEWDWFNCIELRAASPKLGMDVGGILHVAYQGYGSRYDGLAGMNSFTMRLRSFRPVNYFTILDRHPVLDFLYLAYCGRLPFAFLDHRFNDTQWSAPKPKMQIGYESVLGKNWYEDYYYYPIWWR